MITQQEIDNLLNRLFDLEKHLNIKSKQDEYKEMKMRSEDPSLWKDPENAKQVMRTLSKMERIIYNYKKLYTEIDGLKYAYDYKNDLKYTDAELDDYYKEVVKLLENEEMNIMLSQKEDSMSCILKINSGAGGTESQDWAGMLMRMYIKWAENNKYKIIIHNLQNGEKAGIKTVTMQITGDYAYGYLKGENGVHRMVRVSPYNAQGKRMTSFASVFVIPLISDDIYIDIDESKIKWDTFRSGGHGGQNVNKVETGVRLHYIYIDPDTKKEEEIVIENTEDRYQLKNKKNAMNLLRSELYNRALKKKQEKQAKTEAGKKRIEWGSQIRSYIFDDKRVKDHRTNYETTDVDGVMNGDIDGFIKAYLCTPK